jgi:antitoxin VapB
MAINLKNAEAERLLKALAEKTGESLTQAATRAFALRLEQLKRESEATQRRALSTLEDLIAEARAAHGSKDQRTRELTDELWGDE